MICVKTFSGIVGSVLAKEGGISDFFSGALKVLFVQRDYFVSADAYICLCRVIVCIKVQLFWAENLGIFVFSTWSVIIRHYRNNFCIKNWILLVCLDQFCLLIFPLIFFIFLRFLDFVLYWFLYLESSAIRIC